jgi:ABC-2 type transport system permease protein
MTFWSPACWTIAKWEFARYFKIRDQLLGLAALLFLSLVGFVIGLLANSNKQVKLGVSNPDAIFQVSFPEKSSFRLVEGNYSDQQWRLMVEKGDIAGLLIVPSVKTPDEKISLVVRRSPAWMNDLESIVQEQWQKWFVQINNIDTRVAEKLLDPPAIEVVSLNPSKNITGDLVVANIAIFGTMLTSWIAMSFMMTGITGEKQQRVTEQIVSAVRPQTWVDGKLIGITAASIASLANLFLACVLFGILSFWLFGQENMPIALQRWELIPVLLIFYLGSVFFWNCFYLAISAMLNDPHTSSRTVLLFLPMMPLVVAFVWIGEPDGLPMRIASFVPGASATAIPVRLILGEVAWIEWMVSAVLLVAGTLVMRIIAGRIFAACIMLYGTEPSWLDIAAWVCSGRSTTFGQQSRPSVINQSS